MGAGPPFRQDVRREWTIASFDPSRYDQIPVTELLRATALGWIGMDRRMLRSLVSRGEAVVPEVLAFAREPRDEHIINIDTVLIDLFRYYRTPEAIDLLIDAVRRDPQNVDDELVEALLPFADKAVDPLLRLYEELGEEEGSDVAFLLAALRVRDPRVLAVLLDRLEYDAADGAFCLGLYGDPAARPALEKMLAEVPEETDPEEDGDLRREISFAIEQIESPEPQYQPESFDIFEQYPERELPAFAALTEAERIELLSSPDAETRAEAAYTFFNAELGAQARAALLDLAKSDPDANVRGRAWESLADAAEDQSLRENMIAILNDHARAVEERGGAAVALYNFAEGVEVQRGVEALYEEGGVARAKALEAMWRSLWKPYAKYFGPHLDDPDPAILKQALRGAGYFRLTGYADKIAKYFDSEEVRDEALFAYALAMPGETTRGRARGMLRKIDSLTHLTPSESRMVMFAIDERLRLYGLEPVFEAQSYEEAESEPERPAQSSPKAESPKPGRNDPCPCGSGKKYKKCHGK